MKTFLSIGTGSGIGYETAARFAKEGYRVILAARNADKLNILAERLKAMGADVKTIAVDAGSPTSVVALINGVESSFGAVDVLHYNAAAIRQATVEGQSLDSFNSDLAVNIGGALAAIHGLKPAMEARGSGTILLTGGGFALYPNPDYLSLSIGKAGLRALALGLFESAKEKNVHIATVTVCKFVSPETEDTQKIAECFWQLHAQHQVDWTAEITYPG